MSQIINQHRSSISKIQLPPPPPHARPPQNSMPRRSVCSVPFCYKKTDQENSNICFHVVPKAGKIADLWKEVLHTDSLQLVCSAHFTDADYNYPNNVRKKRLRPNSVPTQKLPRHYILEMNKQRSATITAYNQPNAMSSTYNNYSSIVPYNGTPSGSTVPQTTTQSIQQSYIQPPDQSPVLQQLLQSSYSSNYNAVTTSTPYPAPSYSYQSLPPNNSTQIYNAPTCLPPATTPTLYTAINYTKQGNTSDTNDANGNYLSRTTPEWPMPMSFNTAKPEKNSPQRNMGCAPQKSPASIYQQRSSTPQAHSAHGQQKSPVSAYEQPTCTPQVSTDCGPQKSPAYGNQQPSCTPQAHSNYGQQKSPVYAFQPLASTPQAHSNFGQQKSPAYGNQQPSSTPQAHNNYGQQKSPVYAFQPSASTPQVNSNFGQQNSPASVYQQPSSTPQAHSNYGQQKSPVFAFQPSASTPQVHSNFGQQKSPVYANQQPSSTPQAHSNYGQQKSPVFAFQPSASTPQVHSNFGQQKSPVYANQQPSSTPQAHNNYGQQKSPVYAFQPSASTPQVHSNFGQQKSPASVYQQHSSTPQAQSNYGQQKSPVYAFQPSASTPQVNSNFGQHESAASVYQQPSNTHLAHSDYSQQKSSASGYQQPNSVSLYWSTPTQYLPYIYGNIITSTPMNIQGNTGVNSINATSNNTVPVINWNTASLTGVSIPQQISSANDFANPCGQIANTPCIPSVGIQNYNNNVNCDNNSASTAANNRENFRDRTNYPENHQSTIQSNNSSHPPIPSNNSNQKYVSAQTHKSKSSSKQNTISSTPYPNIQEKRRSEQTKLSSNMSASVTATDSDLEAIIQRYLFSSPSPKNPNQITVSSVTSNNSQIPRPPSNARLDNSISITRLPSYAESTENLNVIEPAKNTEAASVPQNNSTNLVSNSNTTNPTPQNMNESAPIPDPIENPTEEREHVLFTVSTKTQGNNQVYEGMATVSILPLSMLSPADNVATTPLHPASAGRVRVRSDLLQSGNNVTFVDPVAEEMEHDGVTDSITMHVSEPTECEKSWMAIDAASNSNDRTEMQPEVPSKEANDTERPLSPATVLRSPNYDDVSDTESAQEHFSNEDTILFQMETNNDGAPEIEANKNNNNETTSVEKSLSMPSLEPAVVSSEADEAIIAFFTNHIAVIQSPSKQVPASNDVEASVPASTEKESNEETVPPAAEVCPSPEPQWDNDEDTIPFVIDEDFHGESDHDETNMVGITENSNSTYCSEAETVSAAHEMANNVPVHENSDDVPIVDEPEIMVSQDEVPMDIEPQTTIEHQIDIPMVILPLTSIVNEDTEDVEMLEEPIISSTVDNQQDDVILIETDDDDDDDDDAVILVSDNLNEKRKSALHDMKEDLDEFEKNMQHELDIMKSSKQSSEAAVKVTDHLPAASEQTLIQFKLTDPITLNPNGDTTVLNDFNIVNLDEENSVVNSLSDCIDETCVGTVSTTTNIPSPEPISSLSSLSFLKTDDDLITSIGVASFEILHKIVEKVLKVEENQPIVNTQLSCTDRVILVLFKLKQNPTFELLTLMFHENSVTTFFKTLYSLKTALLSEIYLRDAIESDAPPCLPLELNSNFSRVRTVFTCFRSNELKCWLGLTLNGVISFIGPSFHKDLSHSKTPSLPAIQSFIEQYNVEQDAVIINYKTSLTQEFKRKSIRVISFDDNDTSMFMDRNLNILSKDTTNKLVAKTYDIIKSFMIVKDMETRFLPFFDNILTIICGVVNFNYENRSDVVDATEE